MMSDDTYVDAFEFYKRSWRAVAPHLEPGVGRCYSLRSRTLEMCELQFEMACVLTSLMRSWYANLCDPFGNIVEIRQKIATMENNTPAMRCAIVAVQDAYDSAYEEAYRICSRVVEDIDYTRYVEELNEYFEILDYFACDPPGTRPFLEDVIRIHHIPEYKRMVISRYAHHMCHLMVHPIAPKFHYVLDSYQRHYRPSEWSLERMNMPHRTPIVPLSAMSSNSTPASLSTISSGQMSGGMINIVTPRNSPDEPEVTHVPLFSPPRTTMTMIDMTLNSSEPEVTTVPVSPRSVIDLTQLTPSSMSSTLYDTSSSVVPASTPPDSHPQLAFHTRYTI